MKRITILLLAVLILLCACGSDPEEHATEASTTTDITTTGSTEPEVTEPPTFAHYEESNAIESITWGAVKHYHIEPADYYGLCAMGDGILLFSGDTETTLTYVTGDNLPLTTTVTGQFFTPEDPSVQVTDSGISYYDKDSHSLVFLDLQLRQISKIGLTDEVPANPLLSQDGKLLYYYTQDALRCLDLRSGISRLLKESGAQMQQVCQLHFGGELLECSISEGETRKTLMVSTQTGETVFSTESQPTLFTAQQSFFAIWQENEQQMQLFGTRGENALRLQPLWEGTFLPQPDQSMVTVYSSDEIGTDLAWYDLTRDGVCSNIRLNGIAAPVGVVVDRETNELWFLSRGMTSGEFALYCWNTSANAAAEEIQTLVPYYTADFPDTEGLNHWKQQANSLGEQYGLQIRIWEDALKVVPDGYMFTSEYSVQVYESCLSMLEKAISVYPQEIYQRLSRKSNNGKLTICLVREIYGSNELGSPTREQGVYFIKDGSSYLVLTINDQIESSYYHELFHAMDSYIIMEAKTFDEWNSLNPGDFSYDNSYITNETRDPQGYLDPENRAFIDVYSMSYPKEDRARVMEYAIQSGNADYFTSPIMAKKLETVCKGIRKAFKLSDDTRVFLWERYLQ